MQPARPSSSCATPRPVFGRIDPRRRPNGRRHRPRERERSESSFHIGRIAVADEEREPVVIDWRAPVAEPFYRATGRDPMGLVRRRHFSTRGPPAARHRGRAVRRGPPRHRQRGRGALRPPRLQHPARRARAGPHRPARRHRRHHPGRAGRDHPVAAVRACSSSRAARARARRSWPCTAPPTSSTPYRFPLEDQGVLVIGPNRVFLRYIERVLPSLGEAGVEQVVLADLVPDVRLRRPSTDRSPPGSRATPAWPTCWPRRSATGSVRCGRTWSCPSA